MAFTVFLIEILLLISSCVSALILLYTIYITFYDLVTRSKVVFYANSSNKAIKTMVSMVYDVKSKHVVELGSGDGRVAIAFAKKGAYVVGIELNLVLIIVSKINSLINFTYNNTKFMHENFWEYKLDKTDIVIVYGLDSIMDKLEQKIITELKPGSIVISNCFKFKNLKLLNEKNKIYMYMII